MYDITVFILNKYSYIHKNIKYMINILKNIILNFLLSNSLVVNDYDSELIYNQDWSKNICKKYFS